jgi:hypothetical protein
MPLAASPPLSASPKVDAPLDASPVDPSVRLLDDLARLSARDAEALYRRARVPDRMDRLDGDLTGRMLALRGADVGPLLGALAGVARAGWFPWAGKSFRSDGARTGAGINRVQLAGRHRLFPFRTRFGASVIDGAPALVLDYDDPDNPGFIRRIHDEVREVAPGLYFGPACWKSRAAEATPVLWFALDARGIARGAGRS